MGLPIAVCRVGYTVRAAFMNQILAQLASPAAIAGYAVYQQADDILCCLTIGIANTVAVLAGILLGEEDRPRMKTLLGTSVQATLRITLVVAVLMWFAAPAFAGLYIDDAEALMYAVRAVRAYAVGMPLYGLSMIYYNYLQGIGRSRLSSIAGFLSEAGFLMLSAAVLSLWFGGDAVWYAFPVTQLLMLIFYRGLIAWENRRARRKAPLSDRLLLLPAAFDAVPDDRMDASIASMDEVMGLSRAVWDFCGRHGCDARRQYFLSLAVEEMAGNTIRHGFPHDRRPHSIDLSLVKKGDDYILRLRDDCLIFDPMKQLTLFSDGEPARHIGLRMTLQMAKEANYTCILKLNNLVLKT